MRILVTGGTGFIGSHSVAALLRDGHSLRLLARTPSKVETALAPLGISRDRVEIVQSDIMDSEGVGTALDGCDAVYHCAGGVGIGRSSGDVHDVNVTGARNVIEGAMERSLDPIVYTSSIAAMYPPTRETTTVDDPVTSLDTAYGKSKAETEHYARELQAGGAPLVTLYPSGVHGPHDPAFGEGSKGLRDRIKHGWPMTTGGMPLVDVRDVADAAARVFENGPGLGPRRYMLGGHFLPWAEEAALCEKILGRKVRKVPMTPVVVRAIGHLVDFIRRMAPSFEYPLTHEAAIILTRAVPCDSDHTLRDLGITFRPPEITLTESAAWLFEKGELTPADAPALATTARRNSD
jgi:nucleoside-diphosphate-sugar epimerase